MYKIISAVLLIIIPLTASANDNKRLNIYQEIDYYTSYSWRGFVLDSDPVIQPLISVNKNEFTVSAFGNLDTVNNDLLNSGEVDLSLNYTKDIGKTAVSLGHINYNYPGLRTNTAEVFTGIQLTTLPLTPNLMYYYDYKDGNSSYTSLDLALSAIKPFELDNLSFSAGGHIGYNHNSRVSGDGGDLGLLLDFGFPLSETSSCSIVLGYSVPFGRVDDAENPNFYGGFRLGFNK